MKIYFLCTLFLFLNLGLAVFTLKVPFQTAGPSRISGGQVENIVDRPVAGAVNRLLPHPMDSSILYAASVNGGIWKTENAYDDVPHWEPLTDDLPSGSIGALQFDYSDKTFNTIIAGVGGSSSLGGLGQSHDGIYISSDGGKNWNVVGKGYIDGHRIYGAAKHQERVVVCSVGYGIGRREKMYVRAGVFFSQDFGKSFERVQDLFSYPCTDLITNPDTPDNFFMATLDGIYETEDAGYSWNKIIDKEQFASYRNARLSVATIQGNTILYGGTLTKQTQQLFRAERLHDGQWSYSIFNATPYHEDDEDVYLNPSKEEKSGGQGTTHFSIAADKDDENIFYACGDRQNLNGNGTNVLGAKDYTGVCFKYTLFNGSIVPQPLTHKFTKSHSAPHADSRNLYMDANGNLVESDDGGIYRRENPKSESGDWFSVNGDIQILESHSVTLLDFDGEEPGSNVWITGNQDTGTTFSYQGKMFKTLSEGDGGIVQSYSSDNHSVVYTTFPLLRCIIRNEINHTENGLEIDSIQTKGLIKETQESLSKLNRNTVNFYNTYYVNRFNPNRIYIPLSFDTMSLESFDGGESYETVRLITNGIGSGIIASVYSGKCNGTEYPDLIISANSDYMVRRLSLDSPAELITSFPPNQIDSTALKSISVHPDNFEIIATLFENGQVTVSYDSGKTWSEISSGTYFTKQEKIIILPTEELTVVVGGLNGLFVYKNGNGWNPLEGLPASYIMDIRYSETKDILYLGTLGRGVWYLENALSLIKNIEDVTSTSRTQITETTAPESKTSETTQNDETSTQSSETTKSDEISTPSSEITQTSETTQTTSTQSSETTQGTTEEETKDTLAQELELYRTLSFILIPSLAALMIICIVLLILFVKAKNGGSSYTSLEPTARYFSD
eukprot:TRINITY_DN9107_c0_g1_i1.p1 TRINITY_DN9107_c0_g1~~TRINITY_DN9107_c0_g1_i1.p1  ORF type:complete len:899 (-),score=206.98 TRINITY_DN9107_c0_g1_i1:9-2705(-)